MKKQGERAGITVFQITVRAEKAEMEKQGERGGIVIVKQKFIYIVDKLENQNKRQTPWCNFFSFLKTSKYF